LQISSTFFLDRNGAWEKASLNQLVVVRFAEVRRSLEFLVEMFAELLRSSSFCSALVRLTNGPSGGVPAHELPQRITEL